MNTFVSVMLYVTIITGQGKDDIKYHVSMPDMKTCFEEAAEFMAHKFPDAVDAKGLAIGCSGKLAEENPS